ncbi:MAG: hypothetical protein EOO96_25085 [Pedobacter sp.]|nr:MAG: hypothetical protein EOO96_25085 [Pedobacter sp.]
MRYIKFLLALTVFMSCKGEAKKVGNTDVPKVLDGRVDSSLVNSKLDSTRRIINSTNKSQEKNISYLFSLEDFPSAEGNEGTAYYNNGKLNKIEIVFFGETGKAIFNYLFKNDVVDVVERRYSYNGMLTDVKSDADMKLSEENHYKIDLKGKRIEDSNTTDSLYLAIMQNVPTKL